MSTTTLSTPAVQPAAFPPPCEPLFFSDGDRYVWGNGDTWQRMGGVWRPVPDDGAGGTFDDGVIQRSLNWAIAHWDRGQRFVPAEPGHDILPGKRLHSALDLQHLVIYFARSAAQYVRSHGYGGLVAVRDLVAEYDEDAAYDFAGTITVRDMGLLLATILAEHERPEVSYDESAGRLYARYEREPEDERPAGNRVAESCLHVFVLSVSPAEA